MKKVIFIVAALMAVFSGVAAVSAYEGHMVDIKVHVENAIGVTEYDLDLGTRFPQETVETDVTWGMTESFFMQDRMSEISYALFFELKPNHADTLDPDDNGYFEPLNPFMILSGDVENLEAQAVYQAIPTLAVATPVGTGTLKWTNTGVGEDLCDNLHMHVDIPVFEGYYNILTDVKPPTWNYGMLYDGEGDDPVDHAQFVLVPEYICSTWVDVPHADLGINLKIQVTGFTQHEGTRTDYTFPEPP